MSYVNEAEVAATAKDRRLKNTGRKLRDWQKEQEHYPKRIDRLDLVGIEEEEENES